MEFINAHGVKYVPDKYLAYSDVSLLPHKCDLDSRNDHRIDLSTKFTSNIKLNIPILSANMDTVTGAEMVLALGKMGGFGILHRYYSSDELFLSDVKKVVDAFGTVAISIGAAKEDLSKIDKVLEILADHQHLVVNVDLAHGHLQKCINQVFAIKNKYGPRVQIIAGNICTAVGAMDLINAGAHAIRVGIGSGSMCTTRIVTGHGVPNLTAIMHCRQAINALGKNTALIADGGITSSGDIIKALAAGADSVMIGGLLSATDETPSPLYIKDYSGNYQVYQPETNTYPDDIKNKLYKKYRGQSSENFLDDLGKTNVAPEGEHVYVPCKGSVVPMFQKLIGGIRSGMTYSGASNLYELSKKALFIEVSYHGYVEGTPHGKTN